MKKESDKQERGDGLGAEYGLARLRGGSFATLRMTEVGVRRTVGVAGGRFGVEVVTRVKDPHAQDRRGGTHVGSNLLRLGHPSSAFCLPFSSMIACSRVQTSVSAKVGKYR